MIMRSLLVALLALAGATAHAHTLSVSHLDVVVTEDGRAMQVELDLALLDLALTLPLDVDRDETITWGELTAIRDPLQALVLTRLRFSTAAGTCVVRPTGLATRRYDDGAYATVQLNVECPSSGTLKIDYNLIFDQDPQHRALITVHRRDAVSTAIARRDASTVSIATAGRGPFLDFLREGIHHILIGYDHLAFLISLLLPATLFRTRDQWQPAPGLRDGLLRVAGVVTAFTVAHSITLGLAAMGWVTPASRWVESAIAASVLLAALNNVYPLVTHRLWRVGFVFGLIHGFGFAGALGELGLPDRARLTALLSFNVGVELGQLAVVAIVMPILFAARDKRWYSRVAMPLLSLLIAAMAAWWLFQRLMASG